MDIAVREPEFAPTSLLPTIVAGAKGTDPSAPEARTRVLETVKSALAAGRTRIRAAFDAGTPVHDTMAAHADLIDQLLRDLLAFAMHHVFPAPNPTTGDRICVASVGGSGRGALAPSSRLHLLFLPPYIGSA